MDENTNDFNTNLEPRKRNFLTTPVAILIAGALIGISVIYSVGKNSVPKPQPAQVDDSFLQGDPEKVKPVSKTDHLLGDSKAAVTVIEFSDTECPFCKRFHETMQEVMKNYKGKVAWVYRHFPLDAIHSKARKEAEATECAAELGGNVAFWKYLDRIFEVTPTNNGLDPEELPKIAKYAGLNVAEFNKCLESGKYAQAVEDQYQDGLAAGVQGTPHSIVITKSGKKLTIGGAQPLESVKKILDLALQEK